MHSKNKEDAFFENKKASLSSDHYHQPYAEFIFKFSKFLAKYYFFHYEGTEHIKNMKTPCLYVANHSIGAAQDVLLMLNMWRRENLNAKTRGIAHKIAWVNPLKILGVGKIGGIYAHPKVAEKFIDQGYSLLCFPGGDVEAFRSFSERYVVNLAHRKGFLKLAKEKKLAIVPITICGTHACYINLFKLNIAHKFFEKKYRVKNFTVNLELLFLIFCLWPSLWKFLPLAFLKIIFPWPTKVNIKVGEPLSPEFVQEHDIDTLYQVVEKSMQHTMNELSKRRITPWY